MTGSKFQDSRIPGKPPDDYGGGESLDSSTNKMSGSKYNQTIITPCPLKSMPDKMREPNNKFPSTSSSKQSNEQAEECAINLDLEQREREHEQEQEQGLEKTLVPSPSNQNQNQNQTLASSSSSAGKSNINTNRVLDPSGSLCYHWSMVVSFAFLYNFWSLSYRFAFREIDFDTVAFWFALDYSADLIYLLDVVINFHTGYLEDGVLQRNIDKIGQHYRECTLFYLDCFCLLPLDILYLSIGFNSILRCTRLVKIYKFWSYSDRTERHTNYPNVFRTFTLVHYILVIFHWNACLFHMISKNKILDIETLYKINDNRCEDILCQYLHAFYWSTLTLTTIGDLPKPRTKGEYFYVTIELFFGLFLFASVLGHVANIVTNVSAARKEFQAKLDAVKTFMRMRRVSDDLQNKVIRWFDYLWVSQKSSDEERSVACLPDRLKAEIAIHVHLDTLKRVDIFQNTEAGFLCELVLRLKPVLFSPGDYVCRKNEVGHEMYIVSKGILEVVTDGQKTVVVATLKAGSYFGEISVLNVGLAGNKRTASVRSVGYSDLFCLNKQDLWDVLKNYPNAEARIRARAEERLSKLGGGGGGGNQLQPLPVARSAPAAASPSRYYYHQHHKVAGSQRRSKQSRQQCQLDCLVGDCCGRRQQQQGLSSTSRRQHQHSMRSARYKSSLQMMNIMNPGRRGHNYDQIVPENYYQNQQFTPGMTTSVGHRPHSSSPLAQSRYAYTGRPPAPPPSAIDFGFDDVGNHDGDDDGDDDDGEDPSLDYEEEDTMVDCGGDGKRPVDSETTLSHHFLPPSSCKVERYGMPRGSKTQSPETAFQPTCLELAAAQRRQPGNNNAPDPNIHQTSEPALGPEVEEAESSLSGAVGLHKPQGATDDGSLASVKGRDRKNLPPGDQRNPTTTDDLAPATVDACQPEAAAAVSKPFATADRGRPAPSGARSSISIANMGAATVAPPYSAPTTAGHHHHYYHPPPVVQPPESRLSSGSISGSCPSGYYLATSSGADQPATSMAGGRRGWQQPVDTCKLASRRHRRHRRLHHDQHRRHSPPASKLDCHSYCCCSNCVCRPNSVEMGHHDMRPEVETMAAAAAEAATCNDDCEMVATYPLANYSARQLERSTSRCRPPYHDTYIVHSNEQHDYQAWPECRPGGCQRQFNRMSDCSRSSRQVQPHPPSAIYHQVGPAPWVQRGPIGDHYNHHHHQQNHSSSGAIPCIHIPLIATATNPINGGNTNLSASACYQLLNTPSHPQQQSVSMSRLDLDAGPKNSHHQASASAAAASWQQNPMLAGASSSSHCNLNQAWTLAPQARDDVIVSDESSKILAPKAREQDPASHPKQPPETTEGDDHVITIDG